jgi:RNA polymerase sigma-70 factor (sigma-E family)
VADRDEELADLYRSHHTEAVRLAWALCRDAALAQELAQDAFVRVYLRRRAFRDPAAGPAYLRRTVVHLAFDANRRAGRRRRAVEQVAAEGLEWIEDPTEPIDPLRSRALLCAVAGLPERRQACVVLRYYLDLTEAETAAALGIAVGTVKSQTHKALAQLREVLGDGAAPAAADPAPDRRRAT